MTPHVQAWLLWSSLYPTYMCICASEQSSLHVAMLSRFAKLLCVHDCLLLQNILDWWVTFWLSIACFCSLKRAAVFSKWQLLFLQCYSVVLHPWYCWLMVVMKAGSHQSSSISAVSSRPIGKNWLFVLLCSFEKISVVQMLFNCFFIWSKFYVVIFFPKHFVTMFNCLLFCVSPTSCYCSWPTSFEFYSVKFLFK